MVESEEEEHKEDEHKELEEEEERDIGEIEIIKQVNVLRDQIMALPLPESLKAYLLYFREKWLMTWCLLSGAAPTETLFSLFLSTNVALFP